MSRVKKTRGHGQGTLKQGKSKVDLKGFNLTRCRL